jgi:hypothetical protein
MAVTEFFGTDVTGVLNKGVQMHVAYDPKNMLGPGAVTRKYLRLLESFPASMWDPLMDKIKKHQKTNTSTIKSHSVNDVSMRWRKWFIKTGRSVETLKGVKKKVRSGDTVGNRTGSFLHDLENSSEPGVSMWEGTPWGGVRRGYGVPIKNGAMEYKINSDAYASIPGWGGYPNWFQNYLVWQNILPTGFLGFTNEQPFLGESIDYMNNTVKKHFVDKFKENPWDRR